MSGRATLDLDSTDVQVCGSKKDGVAYNYAGQRAGRPHLATWAEAGLTTATELLAGNHDVRPRAAAMLRRGLAGIPEQVHTAASAAGRLRVRADAGYLTGDLAIAAVAAVAYAPAGWPAETYTIVRRVRVEAEAISARP